MGPPKMKKAKTSSSKPTGAKPRQSTAAFSMDNDVPDFPRGGASSLSRQEIDEARTEAETEFHRQPSQKKNGTRKRTHPSTRSTNTHDDELGSLFGDSIKGKLPKFANKITFKNISRGMKLWGVIDEVNDKDILVSLPGGLRGLVRPTDASDLPGDNTHLLSTIYHVGQLVPCVVLQLEEDKKEVAKRKIWLSLRLSLLHKGLTLDSIQEGMVLSAYVQSIEDHGFILHFGLPSFAGFMSKHSQFEDRDIRVSEGQILQGVVKSIDKSRKVIHLSSDTDQASKSVTKDLKGLSLDLLVPGMMVNARVQSTLENGVLLSFLTYFTGTVDLFNLDNIFPTSNWRDDYPQNKKLNARILFIDPSSRAVGLTVNPHLVNNMAPASLVKIGDIFDQSEVIRIDKRSGLLLKVPTLPAPTPVYVNVADVADKEIRKLEKSFKEGTIVRARVLGFKHLEGLATGILKTSAFEGSVFTHSDVKPGMLVKAKVIAVDTFGAIVQFAGGVKALCPIRHMSEFEIAKPRKKFQVGVEFVFRVLGCKSKRITVTHKKTLVKSKLEILSSYTDATEGLVTHGWITKIEKHGCFVRFYNGVQGFAPRSELGLDPGSEISSMYHVEQVVKCRVVSCIPASHRINLSFNMSRIKSEDYNVKLGSIVSGVVERITPHAVIVNVNGQAHIKGSISPDHLSDHHGLGELMRSVLKPGYHFDQLLVLDIEGNNLLLTAKYSLVNSASQLPSDASQIRPHSVVHGYICNVIETGCFVRFIGRLTGFAPKNKAVDDRRFDLSEVFYVGQSVRSNIFDVNDESGRVTLSLKQSLCCSVDASFIQEFFLLEEKIAKLQSEEPGRGWSDEFGIGSVIEGKVHETKVFGIVISFQKYPDVFGFITRYQCGATVEKGSVIQAAVLDVSKIERLVDLSVKPEFVSRAKEESSTKKGHKKKRKREVHKELDVNQAVDAQIEIVKENYLVLSIPSHDFMIGYASLTDYNTQKFPQKQFNIGESVKATVTALPSPSTAGRLLLLLKSTSNGLETSSSKRAKKKSNYDVGSLVEAEVTEIKPLELRLKFGPGFLGRIHVTEVSDDNSTDSPFSNFRIGQTLTARIISRSTMSDNKRGSNKWELSVKPSVLKGYDTIDEGFEYSCGQLVSGFVYKVDTDWAWLTISRDVKAQLFILDSASEPTELAQFQERFYVGKAVSGYILTVNKDKKLLRLVLNSVPVNVNGVDSSAPVPFHIHEGGLVGGRIEKILPGVSGLLVKIDHHLHGKVHFMEMTDSLVSDPLSGYREGQFVKCRVLKVNRSVEGKVQVDLSLRCGHSLSQRVGNIEDLHLGMVVQGYVKNLTAKGCFMMLSRNVDAKILISNLSDDYVENPEKEFPVGKLVSGKVLSMDPLSKRVEVTLKKTSSTSTPRSLIDHLNDITMGDIVSGRIKRVESYGLFITIEPTNIVGLCHVSEISDDHLDDIEAKFKPGKIVKAKVLKVDKDRKRVSLGMKSSYLDDAIEEDDSMVGDEPTMPVRSSSPEIDMTNDENWQHVFLPDIGSRASIQPLEVPLDDIETLDIADDTNQNLAAASDAATASNADTTDEKSNKKAKKRAREEREREIRAAEERLLEKDVPKNADEFEKLVRMSPNSSFIWIKYMAFMISMADVEKARSISERALRTINFREESEKLNIWVAYFNLENEYGNPREEAVKKVFERALQYCDPKKVYLALLGVYERTEQNQLADELLDKMIRKFKHSCKVWVRRMEWLLKHKDEGVQSAIKRALLSLPRHKHIKFISQTAILEFKCGVADRGRSMFEGILREYPKRTDLWSVYLDQEIRLGDADIVRALFERAISLSLPPKKMKSLFKKYLEYEKTHGDEERVESVKRKAMEYVESTLT